MANLDQSFDLVGRVSDGQRNNLRKNLEVLEGVNHVAVDSDGRKIIVGYTPGLVTVERIKETIESLGLDVSDGGDD